VFRKLKIKSRAELIVNAQALSSEQRRQPGWGGQGGGNKMKTIVYKGIEISKDDLGRYVAYNPQSPYSKESDSKLLNVSNLKDAKDKVAAYVENGYWD